MHQGDFDKVKRAFRINATDEVTQHQLAGCVECICERFPLPVLERPLLSLPAVRQDIHSDNSSKYVYHGSRADRRAGLGGVRQVALSALQQRRVGWVQNGSVNSKWFGYGYILGRCLKRIDQSYCDKLPLLLNHQSSCHLLL